MVFATPSKSSKFDFNRITKFQNAKFALVYQNSKENLFCKVIRSKELRDIFSFVAPICLK